MVMSGSPSLVHDRMPERLVVVMVKLLYVK
jgi:hypothetical protein